MASRHLNRIYRTQNWPRTPSSDDVKMSLPNRSSPHMLRFSDAGPMKVVPRTSGAGVSQTLREETAGRDTLGGAALGMGI